MVETINCLFCECKSLSCLPDLSKWNLDNIYELSDIFSGCKSQCSFPDISKIYSKSLPILNYFYDKNCINCINFS